MAGSLNTDNQNHGSTAPPIVSSVSFLPPTITRNATTNEDYFDRRRLRLLCTRKMPATMEDFAPQASEILPGQLWLSDVYTATLPTALERLGITHVITLMREPWYEYAPDVNQLIVPLDDTMSEDVLSHFDRVSAWIHGVLTDIPQARILVHCVWGVSRSPTFVIAFLVAKMGMSVMQAFDFVRARRIIACPNRGFMWQLMRYEARLKRISIPA